MERPETTAEVESFDLDEWLAHIQRQHWRTIDLELDRIHAVWQRLGGETSPLVITVAGTNGKGSCVAMLDAVFRAAGYRTGSYTSPHLVRYNERVVVDGQMVSDALLIQAFRDIEAARAGTPLTYFEYGTLCALLIFQQQAVQVSILETGMGGRLDAVNMVDNDIAMITSVGLDHEQWLGSDRVSIGREKAGVFKPGGLAICADPNPPTTIAEVARGKNTTLIQSGQGYRIEAAAQGGWRYHSTHPAVAPSWQALSGDSTPLPGKHQLANLGCVLTALGCLAERWSLDPVCLEGLDETTVRGRCEIVQERPLVIIDVAHNADSARYLGEALRDRPVSGLRYAVFGLLADKALAPIVDSLKDEVDIWFLATLDGDRGQTAAALGEKLLAVIPDAEIQLFDRARDAFARAISLSDEVDRVVAFGSFYTIGDIIEGVKEVFIGHA